MHKNRFGKEARGLTYVLVCCYGYASADSRDPREAKGYHDYLAGVARYLNDLAEADNVTAIFCGGYTLYDIVSEAADAVAHIRHLLDGSIIVVLEEQSKNTEQNIANGVSLAAADFPNPGEEWDEEDMDEDDEDWENDGGPYWDDEEEYWEPRVVVICDKVRRLRVWVSSRILFTKCLVFQQPEVVGIERFDIHPQSRWWVQILMAIKFVLRPRLVLKRAGLG